MTRKIPPPKLPKSKLKPFTNFPYPGMDMRMNMPNISTPQGALDYLRIVNAAKNRG